jgi:hypothetical protein
MSTPDLFTVADIPIWPVEQCDVRHLIDATFDQVYVFTLTADRQAWAPPQFWTPREHHGAHSFPASICPVYRKLDSLYSSLS